MTNDHDLLIRIDERVGDIREDMDGMKTAWTTHLENNVETKKAIVRLDTRQKIIGGGLGVVGIAMAKSVIDWLF